MKQRATPGLPRILFLLLFLLSIGRLQAQDPAFSQFYNQRMVLNPALTGLDEGFAATGHFREQWIRSAPAGFRTWNACVECRTSEIGLGYGLLFQQDQEGAGILTTNSLSGALSYTQVFAKNAALHGGLSAGWSEKFIDFDKLIFSDQINAFTLQNDPGLSNLPPTLADRPDKTHFGSVGGGLAVRGDLPLFKDKDIRKNPFGSIGVSFQHIQGLANPEESLIGDPSVRLPMRWALHGGLSMPLPVGWAGSKVNYMTLTVLMRVLRQGNVGAFSGGTSIGFDNWAVALLTHRGKNLKTSNANAFGISVSKDWKPAEQKSYYKLEFGYDFPTGSVGSQTGGTIEVSLRMRWETLCAAKKKTSTRKKSPPCPKFDDGSHSRTH